LVRNEAPLLHKKFDALSRRHETQNIGQIAAVNIGEFEILRLVSLIGVPSAGRRGPKEPGGTRARDAAPYQHLRARFFQKFARLLMPCLFGIFRLTLEVNRSIEFERLKTEFARKIN